MTNRSCVGHCALIGMLALACAILLCTAMPYAGAAGKGNPNPGISPPQSNAQGQSYGQWAADWWTWVQSIPVDVNPLLDDTGENGDLGQSGSVWFLAGNFGGDAERTVTVPSGKALFFPIFNHIWVNFPTDPPMEGDYLQAVLDGLAATVDAATDLACEIDGRAVQDIESYRCQSPLFEVVLPDNSLWEPYGLAEGDVVTCVDEGYYLMVTPLSVGQHTIHFTNSFLDVTYNITVKGGPKK